MILLHKCAVVEVKAPASRITLHKFVRLICYFSDK